MMLAIDGWFNATDKPKRCYFNVNHIIEVSPVSERATGKAKTYIVLSSGDTCYTEEAAEEIVHRIAFITGSFH